MIKIESGTPLPDNEVQKSAEKLERSAKRLAQYKSFIPTLQFVFSRYIKEHGIECKELLARKLHVEPRQIDHYIHGDTKVPKAKKDSVYKALISICIVLELETIEAFQLMACCGEPYLHYPEGTSKCQHYAILFHPHEHTLLEWNQILKANGFETLDYKQNRNKKPLS